MITVTKPFLPPVDEVKSYLDEIWERNWLTNDGPIVRELEFQLQSFLGVPELIYVTNGTIALQIAIKALGLKGEIITSPFSYVATTSAIVWEGCKPVFVDIDPKTLNIDPALVEAAITPQTSAILATHVFGNSCDVEALQTIAEKYGVKIIYDGAHAFGTFHLGKSLLSYGDVSTVSFHATKLFHTVEGGAIICQDNDLKKRMSLMRNFGHNGPGRYDGVGINGKNSEVHAAVGLVNLRYVEEIISKRRADFQLYKNLLGDIVLDVKEERPQEVQNNSYIPVLFKNESTCIRVIEELKSEDIHPRRYFWPALDELDYVQNSHLPVTRDVVGRVLCLPIYFDISTFEIEKVCHTINKILKE